MLVFRTRCETTRVPIWRSLESSVCFACFTHVPVPRPLERLAARPRPRGLQAAHAHPGAGDPAGARRQATSSAAPPPAPARPPPSCCPSLERLTGKPGTRALVLAPTRELALQIAEQVERFGSGARRALRGGHRRRGHGRADPARCRDGREVIIATPGRLIDHLEQGTARLDDIEVLVLDEADRMLDMGFKPQLARILAAAAASAADDALLRDHGRRGGRVRRARTCATRCGWRSRAAGPRAARADQRVFLVLAEGEDARSLLALLGRGRGLHAGLHAAPSAAPIGSAQALERAGHAVARIHADRSQGQRRAALEGFKNGKYRVLVATDIAARGIDVADIGHVVNFDLPHVPEDYVHRVGRTARASAQRPRVELLLARGGCRCCATSSGWCVRQSRAGQCRASRPRSRPSS